MGFIGKVIRFRLKVFKWILLSFGIFIMLGRY